MIVFLDQSNQEEETQDMVRGTEGQMFYILLLVLACNIPLVLWNTIPISHSNQHDAGCHFPVRLPIEGFPQYFSATFQLVENLPKSMPLPVSAPNIQN
jgi:hypothetical protein